jgi:CxC2 like cysteine cluster associated with KDZ transposases
LLQATLTRESRPHSKKCTGCPSGNLAIWRCIDCTLSHSLCRKCIRESHNPAPLHRIECWNGSYFRPASLWEVGTFLLVQNHDEDSLCDALKFQKSFLDSQQCRKDDEEQIRLQNNINENTSAEAGAKPGPADNISDFDENITSMNDSDTDAAFETTLNDLLGHSTTDGFQYEGDESDNAIADIKMVEYLGPHKNSGPGPAPETGPNFEPGSDFRESTPDADGLNNAYVRVIHTNGIHHIGMVTCSCRGHDQIPLDLFACRLLPASFIRIRTIFTAQLMDYFRLCNLELKASAYQFYQLIRRLTPIGDSDMINLYHEFRRMSRLWRWMKKLKWAGYGHNQQDHLNPPAGSLSVFCPTCPQPTKNLPDNWKLDKNRYDISLIFYYIF